jgi:predicted TIM-barrel fold metal-dependent hydrolase
LNPTRRGFLGASAGLAASAFLGETVASAKAEDRPAWIDCHTHFYDPTRPQGVYWPSKKDTALYRTVLPKHFLEEAAPLGVTRTVVVEASAWVEDNAWLLEQAASGPAIAGVVGKLFPGTPEFAKHLKRFSTDPIYRGIRIDQPAIHSGLERPEFLADIKRLAEAGCEVDASGGPDMLPDIVRLANLVPDLRIILNHCASGGIDGKPPPKAWIFGLRAVAKHPQVYCKVSGLIDFAVPKPGTKTNPTDVDFYRPILDALWDILGEDRLIYGSNWPVCGQWASYKTVFTLAHDYVSARGQTTVEKFFRKNAITAYCLPANRT